MSSTGCHSNDTFRIHCLGSYTWLNDLMENHPKQQHFPQIFTISLLFLCLSSFDFSVMEIFSHQISPIFTFRVRLVGKLCTTIQKCIRPIHKIHRTSKLCTIWTQDGISNVLRMFLFQIVFSFNSFFAVIKTVISSLTLSVLANKNAY